MSSDVVPNFLVFMSSKFRYSIESSLIKYTSLIIQKYSSMLIVLEIFSVR